MAERTVDKTGGKDQEPEEVFLDLHGNPEEGNADADAEILDRIDDDNDALLLDDGALLDGDEEDKDGDKDGEGEGADTDPAPSPEAEEASRLRLELRTERLKRVGVEAQRLEEHELSAKNAITRSDAMMATIKDRLRKAKEDGDTDGEIAALDDHNKAQRERDAAAQTLAGIAQARQGLMKNLEELGYDPETKKFKDIEATPAAPRATPDTQKFLAANKWFSDTKFKPQADLLRSIDTVMSKDPAWKTKIGKAEYLNELAVRFNRVNPGIVKTIQGKPVATGERTRSGAASGAGAMGSAGTRSGTGESRATDPRKVRLNSEDLRQMRTFQLDPDNPKHRESWLREKRNDAARDARH